VPGVLGLHLEGPHLAPARKGAHLAAMLRPLTAAGADRLIEARKRVGLLLVTLAAEMAEPELIRRLVGEGVVVSLGHSDADYATVRCAIEAGARGGTHLFNAMSQLGHRSPGMVGALLDAGEIWCSIIADGHHVDPAALRTALRAKRPPGRIFLTSDAVALVGAAGDSFLLNGRTVRRHDGRLDFPDGTLAGSDLSMAAAVRYAIANLDVAPTEALRMASLYPAMFVGVESRFGLIAPGFAADLVHLDDRFDVTATWIGGALVTEEG
jgi:N-acetylglucosamine-6-phosphate deacetylase